MYCRLISSAAHPLLSPCHVADSADDGFVLCLTVDILKFSAIMKCIGAMAAVDASKAVFMAVVILWGRADQRLN